MASLLVEVNRIGEFANALQVLVKIRRLANNFRIHENVCSNLFPVQCGFWTQEIQAHLETDYELGLPVSLLGIWRHVVLSNGFKAMLRNIAVTQIIK